ncbi:cyclase family protein, partial [Nocardioides hankookensis]
MTTQALLDAVAGGLRVVDLGRMLTVGMPQSPNHPAYWHAHPRRHGDMVRADGGSAANDMISMGTHVGTHVDALSHVSQDGRLHQDRSMVELGVHTITPMVRRGVLLDVPATLGVDRLEAGQEITVADLEATVARQGVAIGAGDVV